MANILKTPVFYASYAVNNEDVTAAGDPGDDRDATIHVNYASPLVHKADDYVVAVERFEINLNGIPMYDGEGEHFSVTRRVDGVHSFVPFDGVVAYSLPDLVQKLNAHMLEMYNLQADGGGRPFAWFGAMSVSMSASGVVKIGLPVLAGVPAWGAAFAFSLAGAPRLQRIIAIDTFDIAPFALAVLGPAVTAVYSIGPRFDCGDPLSHLRITSNLPTVSDQIGQSKANVLTDLYFSKNIGGGALLIDGPGPDLQNVSYSQRQKVVYNPAVRRYLNFRSTAPITDVLLQCEYVQPDGQSFPVPLPPGCEFSIKLGFWNLRNRKTPTDTNFNSRVVNGKEFIVF